jgi:hypothetical protein
MNAADADIENIHQRVPSGFPPYTVRLKVGAISVMLNNYDPKAGLFNGTRVQIIGFVGPNLIRVRILDGRGVHVGQTRLIGRSRFEYGREAGERGIPFTREQFPLDLAHFLTYNKGQGATYQRTGLWNYDAQPFADGMFYTGCSRSTSAAGLKIWGLLGVDRDMALNKVDFELLGVRPRIADDPPVATVPPAPPAQPQNDPAPLRTPRRSPRPEPMDLTRTPRPSLTEEAMELGSIPPTPRTVVSAMDWTDEPQHAQQDNEGQPGDANQQPPTDPGEPDSSVQNSSTDSGRNSGPNYRQL